MPGYENIALNEVQKSSGEWKASYNLNGIGMNTPEILDNPIILKKTTIDEKIAFWKKVMAYGKKRNIDLHFITWNIFDYGTEGKYGITDFRLPTHQNLEPPRRDSSSLTSPLEVAEKLHRLAHGASKDLEDLRAKNNAELQYTLNDIRTVSYLGKYYAPKIAGATQLALFRETKEEQHQKMAVDELKKTLIF